MSEEVKNPEVKAEVVADKIETAKANAPAAAKNGERPVKKDDEKAAPKSNAPAAARNGEAPKRKFGTGSNFSSDNMAAENRGPRGERGRGDRGPRGGGRGRRGDKPAEEKIFEEVTIAVDRVSRSVKGGRRMRFKALVVVGDKKTKVGVGVAKGQDVQMAVQKATGVAKKSLIEIPIVNTTIPHDVEIKHGGARVLLKPAAPGTGIIAGGVVRSVIGVTGITNLLSKSLGSTNKVNIAYATVDALRNLVPREEWVGADKKVKKARGGDDK